MLVTETTTRGGVGTVNVRTNMLEPVFPGVVETICYCDGGP